MLGTHPEHQRRGAGALAMQWGTDQADLEGADAFLWSTPHGKHLYEKSGFEVLEAAEFDFKPYGLDERNQAWAMLRKPRKTI